MKTSPTIVRKDRAQSPHAYDKLRKEGIHLTQELSGNQWTDYNHHDPGVTILEQVCFALTDLIYRTTFDVTDYLCDQDGNVNLPKLGLHRPQDVFFCRPTTKKDLKKALIGMTDGVGLITIENEKQLLTSQGIYNLRFRSSENLSNNDKELYKHKVARNFHKIRGLCEDLAEINFISEALCSLQAEVSIKPGFNVASVLAELFFEAQAVLCQPILYESYSVGLNEGISLDDKLRGPNTDTGLLSDDILEKASESTSLSLLESRILGRSRKIPGIEYLASIRLTPLRTLDGENIQENETRYRLKMPERDVDLRDIKVSVSSQSTHFSFDEFLAEYNTVNFARGEREYAVDEDLELTKPYKGTYRNISRYQSLQNQFPDIYGINQFGIPDNSSPERKAHALQLKSYLLLFEQIMANYLANLDSLDQIYSVQNPNGPTYFTNVLDEKEISDLQKIYPKNAKEILDNSLGKIDDFLDRKSRVLDYLLALYGEEFGQQTLTTLNYYFSSDELARQTILNKIRLLNRIKFASGDRGGAQNFSEVDALSEKPIKETEFEDDSLQSTSGLQYRSSIFLGFKYLHARSLTSPVLRLGLSFYDHLQFKSADSSSTKSNAESENDTGAELERTNFIRSKLSQFGVLNDEEVWLKTLRAGIAKRNYRYNAKQDELILEYSDGSENSAKRENISLLKGLGERSLKLESQILRKILIDLSLESEGMHVIEHILLRPSGFKYLSDRSKEKYANRISVLFPKWTARSSDPSFMAFAEQTVRKNCPSHIAVDFFWLGFEEMCEFEKRYEIWSKFQRNSKSRGVLGSDLASASLLTYLNIQSFRANRLNSERSKMDFQIRESIGAYSEKLANRYEQLKLSLRREDDKELSYLANIRSLQLEIDKFEYRIVHHSDLIEINKTNFHDFEFYNGRISIVLPKFSVFRIRIGQIDYFHALKNIIENVILEYNTSLDFVEFHWLVPEDYREFTRIHNHWIQNRSAYLKYLLNEIKRFDQNSRQTSDSFSWHRLEKAT